MIARAPGKVVLSGAYAVLEGAPAVVTAVDRYVTADTERPATFHTEEVRAALGDVPPPWFDASALRSGPHKLGLGSSAAILVASLGAVFAKERGISDARELRRAVLEPAIVAHRTAQGGGSGIDVAASVHGGTLEAIRKDSGLAVRSLRLPPGLFVEVLFAGIPASTPELVGRVRSFKAKAPSEYQLLLDRLTEAATRAVRAIDAGLGMDLVAALRAQLDGFRDLGRRAGAPIVIAEVDRLAELAAAEDAVVLPAGAGGGDIATYVGLAPPSRKLVAAFDAERHTRLGLALEAEGLHLVPKSP